MQNKNPNAHHWAIYDILIINSLGISFGFRHLALGFLLNILWFVGLGTIIHPPRVQALEPVEVQISVSATLGEPKLTIFGYASPQALVELKGRLVDESVIADDTAYFIFDRVFLLQPFSGAAGQHYPELCLNAIDTASRLGFPVCLPPLPTGPHDITVGPVLLSPTLTMEKGIFSPGEQVIAHGATLPNSTVTIHLANHRPSGLAFVRPALAYDLPTLEIQSDAKGNFEFNLPADTPAAWRVFAAAEHEDSPTAKSPSLAFRVMNWWEWWLVMFQNLPGSLTRFIKPLLWPLLIIAEILIVFILWCIKKQEPGKMTPSSTRSD